MGRDNGLKLGMFISGCDVDGRIAFRLLYTGFIAMGDILLHPAGYVFGGGVEGEGFIEIAMVELFLDQRLDMREVDDHAVLVQLFGTAIYGDDAVVSMQVLALAFVVEGEPVGKGYFYSFGYVIHDRRWVEGIRKSRGRRIRTTALSHEKKFIVFDLGPGWGIPDGFIASNRRRCRAVRP